MPAVGHRKTGKPPGNPNFGNTKLVFTPMPHMREYLLELKLQGRREEYIKPVERSLGYFAIFSDKVGIMHPENIKREHLLNFQAWITNQDWKRSYQIQILKYLRGWIHWLDAVKHIPQDPWVRITIGVENKLPNPLSEDEVQMLFAAHRQSAFVMPPFYFHRREVILTLLYSWGLRIHELHALTCTGMDIRQNEVTAINKGGRTKPVPYDQVLKDVVSRWFRVRGNHARVGEDALLIDNKGEAISIAAIRKIIVELGAKVGLDVNPHQLRDTAATTMLNDEVAIEIIRDIMGHASVKQTMRYARVGGDRIAREHSRVMGPRVMALITAAASEDGDLGENPF